MRFWLDLLPEKKPVFLDPIQETQFMFNYRSNLWVKVDGREIPAGSYALVTRRWVQLLARWIGDRKVLEIMCGSGLLAAALRCCGVHLIATDNASWAEKSFSAWEQPHTDIERMDAVEAVRRYGSECPLLLCSWAPHEDPTLFEAAKAHRSLRPDAQIIYIGEGPGGCVADERFHEHFLPDCCPDIVAIDEVYEPFFAIHDRIRIGRLEVVSKRR